MNIRPLIALALLFALVGCSVDKHAGGYPFEMKGFYPGMPVAEFDALAESYGAISGSDSVDLKYHFFSECIVTEAEHYASESATKARLKSEDERCYRSEMSKFTLGGQPVYSISKNKGYSHPLYETWIQFALHTGDQDKYVKRLKKLLTEKYGEPQKIDEQALMWRITSDKYEDSLMLLGGSVGLSRIDLMARNKQKQSELKSGLEDL